MKKFSSFPSEHMDFIHDVAYDFYGKRVATCSSDRTIKIWQQNAVAEGLDKSSPAWTLQSSWKAHTASVWKLCWAHPVFGQVLASCSYDHTVTIWEEQEGVNQVTWKQKAQLVDSRESVNTIAFAPRHLGLKLATGSSDGFVRVYEAADVLNLSHWQLQNKFKNDDAVEGSGVTCLSWCHRRFDAPMLAVGYDAAETPPSIWVHNSKMKRWQAALQLIGHTDAVHDISWAPTLGRSYYQVATASRDGSVRVWRVKNGKIEQSWLLQQGTKEVWRVDWNVTGTMLASSGDDGRVRLWKQNPKGGFQCSDSIVASSLEMR
eukprot:g466.t1